MGRRWTLWILIAGFPVWLGAAFWYAWPRTTLALVPGAVLVTHRPQVLAGGVWALIAWCLLLFCHLTVEAVRRKPRPWLWQVPVAMGQLALVTAAALIVLVPFSLTYWSQWDTWCDAGRPREVKGVTYHFYLRGERLALARELRATRWFVRSQVVGMTRGTYTAVAIVRPDKGTEYALQAPPADGGAATGRLVLSRSRRWLALIYLADEELSAPLCLLGAAYDLRAGEFYGGKDLYRLSPFLLAQPKDGLNHGDLDSALQAFDSFTVPDSTWPAARLEQALSNPNPHVHNAAAKWLAKLDNDMREQSARPRALLEEP